MYMNTALKESDRCSVRSCSCKAQFSLQQRGTLSYGELDKFVDRISSDLESSQKPTAP